MIKWFKSLFQKKTCDNCIHRSKHKIQSPKGQIVYYCLHEKNSDTDFSYAENRKISTSFPCEFSNLSGHCWRHETEGKPTLTVRDDSLIIIED